MDKDLAEVFGKKREISRGALSALEKVIGKGESFRDLSLETPKVSEKPKEVAPDGFFYLSEMTGGKLPSSGIDHLFPRYAEDYFPEAIREDIPDADEYYVWNPDVAEALYVAYKRNEKALLQGLPGTGKTTAVHQLAAWLRQPYAKFGGKSNIEPSAFLGQAWATHEIVEGTPVPTMVFKEGLLPPAVRLGYICCIDEAMKLSPDVQMALQGLYEKNGWLMLDDKPGTIAEKKVHPADTFRLFLTDNALGTGDSMHLFAATQMQDTSTLDRFTIVIPVGYMEYSAEVGMMSRRYPAVSRDTLDSIVRFAGLVRESYRISDLPVTLSPRGLCAICEVLDEGLPLETAVNLCFSNKLAEDNHKLLVKQQLNTCYIGG